jgi:integrase
MRFAVAIDEYVADMRSQGRINSPNTDAAYRRVLGAHCDDVGDRDPATVGRGGVKTTLRRWAHPNSQRQAHAILVSFYDWAMEEELRDTNPARMVRRARERPVAVFRPTREEVVRLMDASLARRRERWVIHLGVLAGARRAELRGFQGRHFARDGWVWFSPDIAKGSRERWVPVLAELEPIVSEIRTTVGASDYVIPSRRSVDPPIHRELVERPDTPISSSGLYKLVQRVGRRAQLGADIGPHTLRHAYGDHVARYAGLKAAQALMGHTSVETTASTYTERPTLDELAVSVHGFAYRRLSTTAHPDTPQRAADAR